MNWHPPELLFSLGTYPIHTYGVILAVAVLAAFLWAEQRGRARGLDPRHTSDVLFWAVIGAFLGARLGFVIQELPRFFGNPIDILAVWEGGLSFHGGLIGGILGGTPILVRSQKLNQFWQLADVVAAPLFLGVILGRFGNWANQELYGYPTNLLWGIDIDAAHRLPGLEAFTQFHPTFAYEVLLNLIGLFILLFFIERHRRPLPVGTAFLFFITWYGLARGLTEIWRVSDRIGGPLSLAQIVSISMIILGVYFYRRRRQTT